jgi:hypothetical protein
VSAQEADSSSLAGFFVINPLFLIRKKQIEELRQEEQEFKQKYSPKASESDLAQEESNKPVHAVLLGGYARYVLERPSDLAALLQLREHMQLLLQMKVRVAAHALVHALLRALCAFHAVRRHALAVSIVP